MLAFLTLDLRFSPEWIKSGGILRLILRLLATLSILQLRSRYFVLLGRGFSDLSTLALLALSLLLTLPHSCKCLVKSLPSIA